MGLNTIGTIIFGVAVILLAFSITAINGGRANGVSLRPPRWLKRFMLDEPNTR